LSAEIRAFLLKNGKSFTTFANLQSTSNRTVQRQGVDDLVMLPKGLKYFEHLVTFQSFGTSHR
jgi:hypothetical protein